MLITASQVEVWSAVEAKRSTEAPSNQRCAPATCQASRPALSVMRDATRNAKSAWPTPKGVPSRSSSAPRPRLMPRMSWLR